MGLAVTFKWRVGLFCRGINCKFDSGIKSSLCSASTFQKVRLSGVQTSHLVSTRYLPTWVLLAGELLVSSLSTRSNEREND